LQPAALTWHGEIACITLGGSRKVPLLDEKALAAVASGLEEAEARKAPVVLISGGTGGTFAAGADLRRLIGLDPLSAHAFAMRGQGILDTIEEYPGAVIAAIGGRCIGGAFDLVMACDLRVCDRAATFEHPGPALGFITGYGGTSRLPQLAGPASGGVTSGLTTLGAREAHRLGFVVKMTEGSMLRRDSLALAEKIARVPAQRILMLKEALRHLTAAASPAKREQRLAALWMIAGLRDPAGSPDHRA
jgi:enoyl-CoA hydratase